MNLSKLKPIEQGFKHGWKQKLFVLILTINSQSNHKYINKHMEILSSFNKVTIYVYQFIWSGIFEFETPALW